MNSQSLETRAAIQNKGKAHGIGNGQRGMKRIHQIKCVFLKPRDGLTASHGGFKCKIFSWECFKVGWGITSGRITLGEE